jgi:hypothetical protein
MQRGRSVGQGAKKTASRKVLRKLKPWPESPTPLTVGEKAHGIRAVRPSLDCF